VSEPAAGEPPFLPDGVLAGFLLLQGCRNGYGCCGWSVAGSGPISPRRRQSSMAWLDPGTGGVAVLGCVPGRCGSADGLCYCDSNKSQRAMGLLRFIGALGFFSGSDKFESCWFAKDPGVLLYFLVY